MDWAMSAAAPSLLQSSSSSSKFFLFPLNFCCSTQVASSTTTPKNLAFHSSLISRKRNSNFICRAEKEYKFPDPIPEFADSETEKFKTHLFKKLSKKDMFGDSIDEVVGICTQISMKFLHAEYGGPGTLLVIPFIDMADTINERGLPGGPQAARAAVKWAQTHVDKDWKEWTSTRIRMSV
ncbi:UNVERIFIED_CONTAM: protein PLASTID REDOX INSENSITIVE 2, chloroplastic [Sesamum angustifolium]|uniref:Protein PLASTID REDOX INSENSITIVE 2, chloroplastic n=1 Tax=Sesamum angustifolium TaxID=2727405 RepID=A0AAW2KDM6_9LAMI